MLKKLGEFGKWAYKNFNFKMEQTKYIKNT